MYQPHERASWQTNFKHCEEVAVQEEYRGPERRGAGDRKLTEADIEAIKAAFSDHPCRFPSLTTEEVEDLRRVAHVTNKLGNRFIDGVSWAIGVSILAFIYLLVTHRLWPGGK